MARRSYGVAPSNALDLATKGYVDARVPFVGPSFAASRITTDQTLSDATLTEVVFNSEDRDSHAAYNPSTGRFTPQVAGLYQVNAKLVLTSSLTDILNAQNLLYKNGVNYRTLGGSFTATGELQTVVIAGSATVDLNGSTDYISIFTYLDATSGAPKVVVGSFFDAHYVGELPGAQTSAMGEVIHTSSDTYTVSSTTPDVIRMNRSSANSVKLPTLANAPGLLLRKPYLIEQLGTGATTISADTGASLQLRSPLTGLLAGRYAAATAMLVDSTTWWVFGDLVSA